MPDPEEVHPCLSKPKVLVQTGRIRPLSDRSPQGFEYLSNFSPFRASGPGLWMLSNDFYPVSNSCSEGFCSGWIVRLNATGATHSMFT
jgi:hypothetical protein